MTEPGMDGAQPIRQKDAQSRIHDLQRIAQVRASDNERLRSALVQALLELDVATKKLEQIRSLLEPPGEGTESAN